MNKIAGGGVAMNRWTKFEISLVNGERIVICPNDKVVFRKSSNGIGRNNDNCNLCFNEENLIRFIEQTCNTCSIIEINKNCETIYVLVKQICTVVARYD